MILLTVLVCVPAAVRGSTRIVGDDVLAASSLAAAHGRVLALETRWDPTGNAIYTYVTLDVWQSWGAVQLPSRVVVKQMGGRVGATELVIGGQASFALGEEVVVFLEVRPRDGTLTVAGLEHGKWQVGDTLPNGVLAASRSTQRADFQAEAGVDRRALRDVEQLAQLAGRGGAASFVAMPPELAAAPAAAPAWTFLDQLRPSRWHQADSGTAVFVDSQTGGHPQFAGGGLTQLTRAAATWRSASSLPLQYGTTRGPRCAENTENDGRISVTYGDPCNEIPDSSSTLAIGGYYFQSGGDRVVSGHTFRRIIRGQIIVDNTTSKFASMTTGCYEQMLTHELGHTIGFGHSPDTTAIMHGVLRGCGGTIANPLAVDDLTGLGVIYPSSVTPPPPVPTVPGAPQNLMVTPTENGLTIWWTAASGTVTDYWVEGGSLPGARNYGTVNAGAGTMFNVLTGPGTFYVRVRARNAVGYGPYSSEMSATVALPSTPLAPFGLSGNVSGSTVTLNWTPPATGSLPTSYVVQAGSGPGLSNLAAVTVSTPTFTTTGVPPGVYYVRVRSANAVGIGSPSNEIQLAVGVSTPAAPTGLTATVGAGRTVSLAWTVPSSGPPTGYVVEAGSAPGLANLAVMPTGPTPSFQTAGVPPGTYHVRVRAVNGPASGPASANVVVVVP